MLSSIAPEIIYISFYYLIPSSPVISQCAYMYYSSISLRFSLKRSAGKYALYFVITKLSFYYKIIKEFQKFNQTSFFYFS